MSDVRDALRTIAHRGCNALTDASRKASPVGAGKGVTLHAAETVVDEKDGWRLVRSFQGEWFARKVDPPHRGDIRWLGGKGMTNAQARDALRDVAAGRL